ncbi:hypothetical protein PIB30_011051 [Stylosanthes scabra]|uniref:Response regulatory domain-containing protein n=1 Tax=Stylosanthes scabra TaxID=79078 RepID=A0ABU6W583_9FABA|nr:hypothetical protein [Stylosanthes scabra]
MAANNNNNPHDHDPDHQLSTALRLLVVDHDPANLNLIQDLAFQCNYRVTTCCEGSEALNLLREKRECFDVVLCDVHMPGMVDGSPLFDHVLQEFNIPVVVTCSMDDASSSSTVMESMKKQKGACYNLVKPITEEGLSNILQSVSIEKTRKKDYCDDVESEETMNKKKRRSLSIEERDDHHDLQHQQQQPNTPNKKPRFVWTNERHQKFVDAVFHLGIDKAVPKKIMELMDMPQLTRENVASHLQKFRIHMKKKSEETQQQGSIIGNWKPNNNVIGREANNNTSLKKTTNNAHQITQTLPLAPYCDNVISSTADYPLYQSQTAIPDATFKFPNNNNQFGGLINNNGIIGRLHHQNNNNNNHVRSIMLNLMQQPQQLMVQNHYHHDPAHSSSNMFQQSDYYPMAAPRYERYDEGPFQVGMSRGGVGCESSPLFDYYNTCSSTPLGHHQMNNSFGESGTIAEFHGGYNTSPAAASSSSLSSPAAGFFSSRTQQEQQLPNYPTSLAYVAAEALSYLSNSATQVNNLYNSSSSSLFDDYQLGQTLFQG